MDKTKNRMDRAWKQGKIAWIGHVKTKKSDIDSNLLETQ